MSTVAQVIDRVYREYLYPASDQPARGQLTSSINSTTTTVAIDVTILSPEEVDLLGEGVVIEIESEWMLVTAYSAPNLTVIRGYQGTTAAAHDGSTTAIDIYIAPQFSRLQVFDAVCDAVVDLYPDLYAVRTETLTSAAAPVDADANAVETQRFLYDRGDSRYIEGSVSLLLQYPDSATGVAVQFNNVPVGKSGTHTFYSKFPRPTAESDDLGAAAGTWAIPEEWVKIICADALAGLIATRSVDQVNTDHITELLANEGFDVSESRQVITSLLQLRAAWVDRARKRLNAGTNIRISMKG